MLTINEKNAQSRRADLIISAILAVCVTLTAWLLIGGTAIKWRMPLAYDGDAILHLLLINRLGDGNGYFYNTAIGFPFGSLFYDFPGSDGLSLAALWLLRNLSGSSAFSFNFYYLFGFPAAAVSAYWVLRAQSLTRLSSLVAATLFAFAPFHFLRLGHLYYTWYFGIPIFIWYGARISQATTVVWQSKWFTGRRLGHAATLFLISSLGVYYAFFGCMVIGLSAIFGAFKLHSIRPLQHAAIAGAIVAAAVVANLAPNFSFYIEHGRNDAVAARAASESELYGLKITQLLLPQRAHRSNHLREITAHYSNTFPLINENSVSSLGLVAGIGFVLLLGISLAGSRGPGARFSTLHLYAFLTTSLVLIATIGGFSALFAQFVSDLIRAWNRVSIYIAFFSIAAIAYALDFLRKWSADAAITLSVALMALGIWDQSPPANRTYLQQVQQSYLADKTYLAQIESITAPNAAIYQLPYMRFPESGPLEKLTDYDLAKPYLHSKNLRWSFGTIAGREGDAFFHALSLESVEVQFEVIRHLGFAGLYLNRGGFADNGALIEEKIRKLTPAQPLLDGKGQIAFYAIADLPSRPLKELSASAQSLLEKFSLSVENGKVIVGETSPWQIDFRRTLATQVREANGLQLPERWGRWSRGESVKLRLKHELPRKFSITLNVMAFGPNIGKSAMLQIGSTLKPFAAQDHLENITLEFELEQPTDIISIKVPYAVSPASLGSYQDARVIGLGFKEITITPH
jgi:phosphoglycerol transferase